MEKQKKNRDSCETQGWVLTPSGQYTPQIDAHIDGSRWNVFSTHCPTKGVGNRYEPTFFGRLSDPTARKSKSFIQSKLRRNKNFKLKLFI